MDIYPINDQQLEKRIEALTRHAALKAMAPANFIRIVDNSATEKHFNYNLGLAIKRELSIGLRNGGLGEITEEQFEQELYKSISHQEQLNGAWSKLRKKINKSVKKVAGITLIGKTHGNPLKKAVKSIAKSTKKVAKDAAKVVKKAAPYAVAGAALYYGYPYLKAGVSTLMSSQTAQKAKNFVAQQVQNKILPPASTVQPLPANSGDMNAIATLLASQIAARQGVMMQSPEAQNVMSSYVAEQQENIADVSGEKKKGDIKNLLLPAAGILAAKVLLFS